WEAREQTTRLSRKAVQKIGALKTKLAEQQKAKAAQKVRQLEKEARQESKRQAEAVTEPELLPEETVPILPVTEEVLDEPIFDESPIGVVEEVVPHHIERFRSLYQPKASPLITEPVSLIKSPKQNSLVQRKSWLSFSKRWLRTVLSTLNTLSQAILKQKKILLLSLGGLLIVSGFGFWLLQLKTNPVHVDLQTSSPETSTPTPANLETNTLQPESTFALDKELVALSFLENRAYGATTKSIVAVDSKEEFAIPDLKGEIRFLAPMEDLRLLFILTSQNELFAWSPLAKTLTKNELALPANARVVGMGTYITYLYVLDRGNNQLYRYPRSAAGFTESASWMRESLELTDVTYLAINETVALAPSREDLLSFSQGKKTGAFDPDDSARSLTLRALTTDSDFPFIYALDEESTLSIWNLERKLLHTYSLKDAPKDASYLASDPEKKVLILGNKEGDITRYSNITSE
ncbi:MAG: hypothetical protein AAB845_02185, partial [Patescibacteria group bacterium]